MVLILLLCGLYTRCKPQFTEKISVLKTSSPSSGRRELKTPAGGRTFVAMATFIGVIYFSWERLMEGTRGAVRNRFSFVSPLSASVAVTKSRTATVQVSAVPEHFV